MPGFMNKFTITYNLDKAGMPLALSLERGQNWLALSDPLPCTLKVTFHGPWACRKHPPLSVFQPLFLSISTRLYGLSLIGHGHYWKELIATLPPLPELRSFRFVSSCTDRVHTQDLSFSANIPWSNLTFIGIRDRERLRIDDAIEALFRCPSLTAFYYRSSFCRPTPVNPPPTRSLQQFGHLKRLALELDPGSRGDTITLFFQFLRLPVLEDLTIRCDTSEIIDISYVFNKLYERDPFRLRSLKLDGVTIHIDSFTDLLSVAPSLERLELTRIGCWYEALLRNLIFSRKEKNPMLPRLQTVVIREKNIDAEVGTVIALVESRWWDDDESSKDKPSLRIFRLECGKFDVEEKLSLWRSQGLDIAFKDF
ncbi:hypothetical protein BDN72DRAFT_849502 [Pluteus cervinus]|uniref:Uncharacterized protein n=1 Tax=Pluteus cervinus TaxID=181527 RepID=A0ACD3A879_9AGAR|nr:hypothetical protein BDN72DRAFT_849502 [Pluteus cervinus]